MHEQQQQQQQQRLREAAADGSRLSWCPVLVHKATTTGRFLAQISNIKHSWSASPPLQDHCFFLKSIDDAHNLRVRIRQGRRMGKEQRPPPKHPRNMCPPAPHLRLPCNRAPPPPPTCAAAGSSSTQACPT